MQKANKMRNVFYTKSQTLFKKQDNFRYVLYTKSQTLCKRQDNFCYVFIYKKQDTLRYAIFHENFEVGVYKQKA